MPITNKIRKGIIKNKRLGVLLLIIFCSVHTFSQQLFESSIIYGGVTGGGFSTNSGSGMVSSNILIPPNSTIKKAYLLATRNNKAPDITVVLNGLNYIFSDSSIASSNFTSVNITSIQYTNSTIHALDILNDIDSSILNYSLIIPPQFNVVANGYYSSFYLYIVYENLSLPKISYSLFINDQNVNPFTNYNLTGLSPLKNNKPVGLELFNYFFCDTLQDGSYIDVNGSQLGLLGGSDANSSAWSCTGTYASFAHYNDSLFGLDDDTPDSLMAATDALADIRSYVNNGDTVVDITFTYQSNWGPYSNPVAALMLSYATPCDTFSTSASSTTDTICQGESVQLNAAGGVQYSWYSPFSTFNDSTLANPIATPTQTTTYIVTITNDSGCVKTEHVKVWVTPTPKPDTITATPQSCGNTDGSITVGNITQDSPPYNYQLTNLQTLNTQNSTLNTFSNLLAGNYEIQITDALGCSWKDSVTCAEINDISANFNLYTIPTVIPQPNPIGTAPLTIYTQNSSVNANSFEWWLMSNELGIRDTIEQIPVCTGMMSNCDFQHTFEQGGTYEFCLWAYNNLPQCSDTLCKTIAIDSVLTIDSVAFIIPNVFSPNIDGFNDDFVLQIEGVNLLEKIEMEIFNRWGMLVVSKQFTSGQLSEISSQQLTIWDGTTTTGKKVPEGTYFYIINYTKTTGENKSLKGTISLLR